MFVGVEDRGHSADLGKAPPSHLGLRSHTARVELQKEE